MRRMPVRFLLPTFLVALLLVLLVVTGRTTQSPLKIIIYTDFLCGACGRLHS